MKDGIKICALVLALVFLLTGLIKEYQPLLLAGAGIFDLTLLVSLILIVRNKANQEDFAVTTPRMKKINALIIVLILFVGVSCLTSEIHYVKLAGILTWSFFFMYAGLREMIIKKMLFPAMLGYGGRIR